jgi:hypothetical protein
VDEWTALLAGEDAPVHALREVLGAEDEAGAGAAEGLVGGGGDHVRVRHGRGMHAAGDEAREVCHIDEEFRADLVRDGAEPREVELARVG